MNWVVEIFSQQQSLTLEIVGSHKLHIYMIQLNDFVSVVCKYLCFLSFKIQIYSVVNMCKLTFVVDHKNNSFIQIYSIINMCKLIFLINHKKITNLIKYPFF